MIPRPRSACPINRSLEMLGDRWSLLILRDIVLHDRRSFRELLTGSEEGISAPVLSRRLTDLVEAGFLTKSKVARGKQGRYSLTEQGLATVPLLIELGRLGRHRALDGFIRPFGLARLVRLARLIDYGNRPRPDGPIPHDIDYRSPSALLRPPSLHRTLINEGDHGYVFSPLLIGRGQCAAVADVGLELLEVVLR